MLKRVVKYIIILVLVIALVGGCSEFFGTVNGRVAANKHAIEFIHKEYNIPVDQLEAGILPSYRYGVRQYLTKIYDTKEQKEYSVLVRMRSNFDVMDIYEER
ncbi:hypothetical protein ABEZ21_23950 [Brevibacillus porteri]|uniref:DUF3139 domain-containing protein n=1 Tax=Brevibacillus porteri TaxID=2126350 RepID=A0ABX5FFJ6_9BACL|nr:hypothetical protein [Brevibacillus porteri]MED1803065.1 hypothetical protein [Brevibacillus porteri]MED2135331.1 hypothetical protein [Brevibacillus porteri]MED2748761.1 hypothetical protein [Brevibacillus porteri]MED2818409.1 hypothetical protein [Brevibacillus porteri]MED4899571.1 hypothetical protein [Brevibacillus porteri]